MNNGQDELEVSVRIDFEGSLLFHKPQLYYSVDSGAIIVRTRSCEYIPYPVGERMECFRNARHQECLRTEEMEIIGFSVKDALPFCREHGLLHGRRVLISALLEELSKSFSDLTEFIGDTINPLIQREELEDAVVLM